MTTSELETRRRLLPASGMAGGAALTATSIPFVNSPKPSQRAPNTDGTLSRWTSANWPPEK